MFSYKDWISCLICGRSVFSAWANDLFEKRHSGDYDDFVICDQEMVDNLLPKAKHFIDAISQLL